MTENPPHLHLLIQPLWPSTPDIACADWDLLFRAVLERLAALEQLRQSAIDGLPADRARLRP